MSTYASFKRRPGHEPFQAPGAYYRLRRKQREAKKALGPGPPTLASITQVDDLIAVFNRLKHEGGQAPGPDHIGYADLGRGEVANIMRLLAQALTDGSYRPSPPRQVKIPKVSGLGRRELWISNIADRVVAASLHQVLTPFWDKSFLNGSFGFRPGRSVWDLLLALEGYLITQRRWFLVVDDIRDAFDNVPLATVMKAQQTHLTDNQLVALIECSLRGSLASVRDRGIPQGHAYSPTALNVCLHFAHDAPWQSNVSNPPWFRYADNVIYTCHTETEAHQALTRAKELLGASGFTLKGEQAGSVFDLKNGMTARILGFGLGHQAGTLCYNLTDAAWEGLRRDLLLAHEAPSPPATAWQAMRGWLSAYGPAFNEPVQPVAQKLRQILENTGFIGLSSVSALTQLITQAHSQWIRRRNLTALG